MEVTAVEGKTICDAREMARILEQMADAILERNRDRSKLALVGILSRGVCLARRLQKLIAEKGGRELPLGILDITLYRDDLSHATHHPVLRQTEIPFSLDGATVILVDDVLYTGHVGPKAGEVLDKAKIAYHEHTEGTIEEVYEPFLIQEGYLMRTPRGREATDAAYSHLGKSKLPDQKNLFS